MAPSMNRLEEARRALDTPLFAGLPGDADISFEFFPPKRGNFLRFVSC